MNHPRRMLRDQIQALEQLQELDLKIDQAENKRKALPIELRDILAELASATAQMTAVDSKIEETQKSIRQVVAAVELNEDRSKRSMEKLQAVSSGPEFQAANKEIDQLKKMKESLAKQKDSFETELLTAEEERTKLQAIVQEIEVRKTAKEQEVNQAGDVISKDIAGLETTRKSLTSQVDQSVLRVYDRIRKGREGVGLAVANSGRCGACNMIVPPQMFNEVLKGERMLQCQSCNRILYSPRKDEEAEAAASS